MVCTSVGQFWFLADFNFNSWCDHRVPGMLVQNFEKQFQNQNQNQRLARTGPRTKTGTKINLVYLICGLKKKKLISSFFVTRVRHVVSLIKKFKVLNNNGNVYLNSNLGVGWAMGIMHAVLTFGTCFKYANFKIKFTLMSLGI